MNDELFFLSHRGMDCIGIRIDKTDNRNLRIRIINDIKWSKTQRCWYCSSTTDNILLLEEIFGYKIYSGRVKHPVWNHTTELEKFKKAMEVKRLSKNTIKNYMNAIIKYIEYFGPEWINADKNMMIEFQNEVIIKSKLSPQYQNIIINSIKKFYFVDTGKEMDDDLVTRPKAAKKLPIVLSQEDVKKLLVSIQNVKHKCMLCVVYACGLRNGELRNLIFSDFNADRGILLIREAKGKKDRIVPLSEGILKMLREYYMAFKPEKFMFEGQFKGEQYSARSLQEVFKQALKGAGLDKTLTLHCLRHSYATHLMEKGTNLRVIQELLGHKSSKTTEIYTHVSTTFLQKVKSPFDDLEL